MDIGKKMKMQFNSIAQTVPGILLATAQQMHCVLLYVYLRAWTEVCVRRLILARVQVIILENFASSKNAKK